MCGISGFFGNKVLDKNILYQTLSLMSSRGPDNQEIKQIKLSHKKLYFLHSRLSIIDVEPRSNQPFEIENFI